MTSTLEGVLREVGFEPVERLRVERKGDYLKIFQYWEGEERPQTFVCERSLPLPIAIKRRRPNGKVSCTLVLLEGADGTYTAWSKTYSISDELREILYGSGLATIRDHLRLNESLVSAA